MKLFALAAAVCGLGPTLGAAKKPGSEEQLVPGMAFFQVDKDHDGLVSHSEVAAWVDIQIPGAKAEDKKDIMKQVVAAFQEADVDKDDYLSQTEYLGFFEKVHTLFDKYNEIQTPRKKAVELKVERPWYEELTKEKPEPVELLAKAKAKNKDKKKPAKSKKSLRGQKRKGKTEQKKPLELLAKAKAKKNDKKKPVKSKKSLRVQKRKGKKEANNKNGLAENLSPDADAPEETM